MNVIRHATAVVMVLGLAGTVVAQDAMDRLEKARDAALNATAMSYDLKVKSSGGFGPGLEIVGSVEMLRNPTRPGTWFVKREGVAKLTGMPDIQFLVITDGSITQWIDHDKKTVYERYNHAARDRQITVSQNGWLMQLADRKPFERDLAAPSVTLQGVEELNGTLCEIVFVDNGENRQNMKWWLSIEDGLPRKLEQTLSGAGMSMSTVYELSNFKLNPEFKPERFRIEAPAGYAEERIPRAPETVPVEPVPGVIQLTPDSGSDHEHGHGQTQPILKQAPDFELAGPDGKKIKLSDLRGKVVVLDFWGTWCFPCKKSTPELQRLHEDYKDKPVKVFGLAVKESDWSAPEKYMKDGGFTYPILLRADEVAKQYAVRAYPSFFVIGTEGHIIHEARGFKENETFAGIRRAIDAHLAGEPPAAKPGDPGDDARHEGQSTTTTDGGTTTTPGRR